MKVYTNHFIALGLSVFLCLFLGQKVKAQNLGLTETELFTKGFPGAFFFRSSEGIGKMEYKNWEKTFNRLGGIMGKSQNEEIPGRASNVTFFSKFKKEHPEQLVMLHYNGNARDPRDGGEKFHAGHWLYFEGTKALSDIDAEEGITEIKLEDPSIFKMAVGRYKNRNEDIGICRITSDGKPDWNYAEQVQLVSVDKKNKTIKVKRGQFGTSPKIFEAGKTLISPHVAEGPWGENNNLLWLYNHSTKSLEDANGKTCNDILVEEFEQKFSKKGELNLFDGVEFDVLWNKITDLTHGRKADSDYDGIGDNGIIDGVNAYSIGVFEFCKMLRESIGNDKLIMADGMNSELQRGIGYLNGIESEGWPDLRDTEVKDWSGGWNRHLFWNQNAFKPAFNFVNFKYLPILEMPPLGRQRLVWAATLLLDARITHSGFRIVKPKDGINREVIDEFVGGNRNEKYWLGQALEPSVRIALNKTDLLEGAGKGLSNGFISKIQGDDIQLVKNEGALRIKKETKGDLKFTMPSIKCDGPDLVISMKVKCDPRFGYPEKMPRLLNAYLGKDPDYKLMSYVNEDWFHVTFYFRDIASKAVDLQFEIESNESLWVKDFTVHAFPDVVYRRFENGIVIANPAHHEFEFDLKKVANGIQYFHLNGTQDQGVNNGEKASDKILLKEREGLFLETRDR